MLNTRLLAPLPSVLLALASVPMPSCIAATAAQAPPPEPPAAPAPASDAAPAPAPPPAGTVIEGAINVYTWAPEDRFRKVEAKDIDLRKVFEDLGPVATRWYQHVLTLSNPWFEGRAPGLRGNDLAAEYLSFWMRESGLKPAFPEAAAPGAEVTKDAPWTSYRQPFELPGTKRDVESAALALAGADLERAKDFEVMGMSGSGSADAPVTFVGYGIERGRDGYSSFDDASDLRGRIAMVFRYEPLDERGGSRWRDNGFSEHASMAAKVAALAERGAVGIVLVAPPGVRDGKTALEKVSSSRWARPIDVPMVQVTADVAERLLRAGSGGTDTLADWRRRADAGEVKCVSLGDASRLRMQAKLTSDATPTQNVGGVLRGKGALADEWVVVGAHFDHVGYGFFGSSPEYTGQLHPGADDNASGTAAMLCVAEALAGRYASEDAPQALRSVLFLGFTAEESGLRGSKWFVEHPTIPGDRTSLMVNMDMVGRLRSDDLSVGGMESAKGMIDVMRPVFERSGLTIRADPSGRGPSDHASFYGAGIPVVFVYTGNHDEYHTPKDKGYTVNPEGAAKIVAMVTDMVMTVASRPERLEFKSGGGRTADRGYAAVRLGVMPGMGDDRPENAPDGGVLVASVSEDTSASAAGIKEGDILVGWNGEDLADTKDMMTRLRSHKPGDVVRVRIWRDGKEETVEVTMRASKPKE
jgi:hypothetical protein